MFYDCESGCLITSPDGDTASGYQINEKIENLRTLTEENKKLKNTIEKAIHKLERGITFCENDSQGIYEKCNIAIHREKSVLEILKGEPEE